ncbi:DUF6343 family protein [Streptomyces dubilierae]|uniref:DUF6343 family protein n=1 Tax=Streptomyces dubilierae TaxID=3075533 RepID=A0ABU2PBU1_9ACTN|nr:DUF6343 family protein [Streptomyces sp. DSM 41921]MDT0389622.1 DUF6343 family protein [Streptomyces sp. DSM 41921]
MRTGSEPRTARSALRARFWLSLWGLVWAVVGTVAFTLAGRTGWAIACGVLLLVVTTDLAVVLRHIRQGPHYQPGPDIPPYRPVDDRPARHRAPGHPPAEDRQAGDPPPDERP